MSSLEDSDQTSGKPKKVEELQKMDQMDTPEQGGNLSG